MECQNSIFYKLPEGISIHIVNLSKEVSNVKILEKKLCEIGKKSLNCVNNELAKQCDTFKAIVNSGKGDIKLSTKIFIRLMNRLHDTAKFIRCDKSPTQEDLKFMDRLTWERKHCDELIASLQEVAKSSDLSMEDLITLGDLTYKLNLFTDGKTPREEFMIGIILMYLIPVIHKNIFLQFYDQEIEEKDIRNYFSNLGSKKYFPPKNKTDMESTTTVVKKLLDAYRKELLVIQNQLLPLSYDPNVYLVHFLKIKLNQLLDYKDSPASTISSDKLPLENKKQILQPYLTVFQELIAREYAEDKGIQIDDKWQDTFKQINDDEEYEEFDEDYFTYENFKTFLKKHLLGRETSEGPITKEDIKKHAWQNFPLDTDDPMEIAKYQP